MASLYDAFEHPLMDRILDRARPIHVTLAAAMFSASIAGLVSFFAYGRWDPLFIASGGGIAILCAYPVCVLFFVYYGRVKRSEAQATKANRYKSMFLANASHDIRTPLDAIVGYTDLLRSMELAATEREYIEHIAHSNMILKQLIDDVLEFSKIEAGNLQLDYLDYSPAQLMDLVGGLIATQVRAAQAKGVVVELATIRANVPARVIGVPFRVQQIMMNLISNALKFTDEGMVEYGVRLLEGEKLRYYVSDSGPGISPEQSESIFEPFYQLDNHAMNKSSHSTGFGLGLSICKQLATLMGATIGLKSKVGTGHGSFFYLDIPLQPPLDAAARAAVRPIEWLPQSAQMVTPDFNTKDLLVLLVEDNEVSLQLARRILEIEGYRVCLARDGEQALALWQSEAEIALILMDVQMPVMDGRQAIREIRALEQFGARPRTPIIVFSASATSEEMEEARRAGCDDYVTKPIDRQVFLERVRSHARQPQV